MCVCRTWRANIRVETDVETGVTRSHDHASFKKIASRKGLHRTVAPNYNVPAYIEKKKNLTIFFLRYIFVLSELCRSKLFGNCLDINFIPATKHKEWPFNKDSLPEVKYVLLE